MGTRMVDGIENANYVSQDCVRSWTPDSGTPGQSRGTSLRELSTREVCAGVSMQSAEVAQARRRSACVTHRKSSLPRATQRFGLLHSLPSQAGGRGRVSTCRVRPPAVSAHAPALAYQQTKGRTSCRCKEGSCSQSRLQRRSPDAAAPCCVRWHPRTTLQHFGRSCSAPLCPSGNARVRTCGLRSGPYGRERSVRSAPSCTRCSQRFGSPHSPKIAPSRPPACSLPPSRP